MVLSEISQTKTSIVMISLLCGIEKKKKSNLKKQKSDLWLPEAKGRECGRQAVKGTNFQL